MILNALIHEKNSQLTLKYLNERVQNFNYGRNVSNKYIPPFTESHFKNNHYICSSSEMTILIKLLSLMIGHLISPESQAWQLFLKLRHITCILLTDSVDSKLINTFENLISEHHQLYLKLSGNNLKPKFHFLLHYPRIFRAIGPLTHLSCLRFEAKHSDFKRHAQVIKNRKNICYSLAIMNQLMLNERFISSRGFEPRLSAGPSSIVKLTDLKDYNMFCEHIPRSLDALILTNPVWIERNGIQYMNNMVLKYEHPNKFATIKYILLNGDKLMFLVILNVTTFDEHYHAFSILESNTWKIVAYETLADVKPRDEYAVANGLNYIIC